MKHYFKEFKFSPIATFVSLVLAALMFWAATWQWSRYHEKVALVETYEKHSSSKAIPLSVAELSEQKIAELEDLKVSLHGRYDLENQVVISNRRYQSQAGYWLLAPFLPTNGTKAVYVSRGFIPFEERTPESWKKFDYEESFALEGVLKESVSKKSFFSPSSAQPGVAEVKRQTIWLYPDIEKIASSLPYEVDTRIFIQKLGGPFFGEFPAQDVTIDVPPQTHFGYTIEWIILGVVTLLIGFLLQAFPRKRFQIKGQGNVET